MFVSVQAPPMYFKRRAPNNEILLFQTILREKKTLKSVTKKRIYSFMSLSLHVHIYKTALQSMVSVNWIYLAILLCILQCY